MKGSWLVKPVVLLAASLALCAASLAQERGCLETSAMGRMASANSPATLNARKQKAADSYRAQVIFAARMLEIETQDKSAAELLLNLIPKSIDDPRQQVWLELGELPQCPSGGVPDSDLKPLFRLQYHLPDLLERAALLAPDKMPDYVAYAYVSIQNPDSDYAVQMRKVCRAKHREFVNAVDMLPPEDKKWFVEKIFNLSGCRTIAFSEQ
jgi:hypothetical protein